MSDRNPPTIDDITALYTRQLKQSGQVSVRYHNPAQRDLLRRAGRRAGHQLNRPVRTFDNGGTVLVVLTDWGTNPLEARLTEARANKLIERVFPDLDT